MSSESIFTGYASMYSRERLAHLRDYRYCAIDRSPISRYILAPYWNWAVTLLPLWMAPNLVTLTGLAFMVGALAIVIVLIPDLVGPGPSWAYFAFAAAMWLYSTLDSIDGKQARRTGSSSPLGELFDHGCDALNCSVGGLVQIASMGLGASPPYAQLIMTLTFWGFYLPTWEEYHTGILSLGYVNGPTEGLLLAIATMILSGLYGPQLWTRTIGEVAPRLLVERLAGHPLAAVRIDTALATALVAVFSTLYIPSCVVAVYRACRAKNGPAKQSFGRALSQLLPLATMTAAAFFWLHSPVARVENFLIFILAFGIAFGKMATKIIYAHLTRRRFPSDTGLMVPLYAGALLFNVPSLSARLAPHIDIAHLERYYIYGWLAVAVVGYGLWAYNVVASFCAYLDISCFAIKKRPAAVHGVARPAADATPRKAPRKQRRAA